MPWAETPLRRDCICLLLYHPDDTASAEKLKALLSDEGFPCWLLYEDVGAHIHTGMFELADAANCVIGLFTETLFGDRMKFEYVQKVYSRLQGEKFVAVRLNLSDETFNSPRGGFLEGCHLLQKSRLAENFPKRLVSAICSVAGDKNTTDLPYKAEMYDILSNLKTVLASGNESLAYDFFAQINKLQNGAKPLRPVSDDHKWYYLTPPTSLPNIQQKINVSVRDFSTQKTEKPPYPDNQLSRRVTDTYENAVDTSDVHDVCEESLLAPMPLDKMHERNQLVKLRLSRDAPVNEIEKIKNEPKKDIGLSQEYGSSKPGSHMHNIMETVIENWLTDNSYFVQSEGLLTNFDRFKNVQTMLERKRDESVKQGSILHKLAELYQRLTAHLSGIDLQQLLRPDDLDPLEYVRRYVRSDSNAPALTDEEIFIASTSEVHEETSGPLISPVSSTHKEVRKCMFKMPCGKDITAVRKVLSHASQKKSLRSPFLLPEFDAQEQGSLCEIFTPYMAGGNLDEFMQSVSRNRPTLTSFNKIRVRLIAATYQVIEAIHVLHFQKCTHGNITLKKILLDGNGNVRVVCDTVKLNQVNCQDDSSTHNFKALKYRDIVDIGIAVSLLLNWREQDKVIDSLSRADFLQQQLPEPDQMAVDERYVDPHIWTPGDDTTVQICKIIYNCIQPSQTTLDDIRRQAKQLMQKLGLPLATFRENLCVYCKEGTLDRRLKAHTVNCGGKVECMFLKICPSCMARASSDSFHCPEHDVPIIPPIGGERAYALVICGQDKKAQTSETSATSFDEDVREIVNTTAHPRIMAIPPKNIFRISPTENCTENEIENIIRYFVAQKPTSFLLVYSGHCEGFGQTSKFDVSDAQGQALNCEKLKKLLNPLLIKCPRVLYILDCCHAAGMESLLTDARQPKDEHIIYHTMWPACGRSESANVEPYEKNSVFTKCLVAGLKGARECPNSTSRDACESCTNFRREIEADRFIIRSALEKYVHFHMKDRFQEGRDDVQRPLVSDFRRESDPPIAYFIDQALYRFHYEPPDHEQWKRCICELDMLDFGINDVLERLWNKLKLGTLPSHLDHKALRICQRIGENLRELNTVREITEAVFENQNSLVLTIRTDGTELTEDKWVACFCKEAETEQLVKCLRYVNGNTYEAVEHGHNLLFVKEIFSDWRPRESDSFYRTFNQCWDSFLRQKKKDQQCLRVEIRTQLAMISIAYPKADGNPN